MESQFYAGSSNRDQLIMLKLLSEQSMVVSFIFTVQGRADLRKKYSKIYKDHLANEQDRVRVHCRIDSVVGGIIKATKLSRSKDGTGDYDNDYFHVYRIPEGGDSVSFEFQLHQVYDDIDISKVPIA